MTAYIPAEQPTRLPVGFSEGLGVLAAASTFLVAVFGHDWGVSRVAQDVSVAGPVVIPMALAYTRALKHRAHAMVKAAAVTSASKTSPPATK